MLFVLKTIFSLLAALTVLQLLYPLTTILLGRVLGREKTTPVYNPPVRFDYGCIITAYKNAAIAGPLAKSLLKQSYDNFHIYLIADECPDHDFEIDDTRFTLLRPDPPLRLKAKSILYGIEHFKRPHPYIAVFDADNLAHPDFLSEINRYANAGHLCIQGQRKAKNLDTTYAALDSMGEHYKNYLERYVPYLLGGSSVISGSGMATEAGLYKAYLASPEIESGKEQWKKMLQEDKILQNFILRQNKKIAYARKAVVYDEKVDSGGAVETQRSRWLFSYFQNLPNSAGIFLRGLGGLHWNQLYFGFVTLALPMFIQVGLALALALAGLFIRPAWSLALAGALFFFAAGVLLALKWDEAPKPVWDAVWKVPKFILRQFAGLFKMGNPNKNFIHTEHKKFISVEDVTGGTKAGKAGDEGK
jgi:cellulose synthase/poly-beta-1,6-N-acetylglucosamine synthase-like glycosyltransferase